jgi:hypothetical protein
LVVKETSEDMTELDDAHHLSKILLADFDQELFKEIFVVVEGESNIKFRLEALPDVA